MYFAIVHAMEDERYFLNKIYVTFGYMNLTFSLKVIFICSVNNNESVMLLFTQ